MEFMKSLLGINFERIEKEVKDAIEDQFRQLYPNGYYYNFIDDYKFRYLNNINIFIVILGLILILNQILILNV